MMNTENDNYFDHDADIGVIGRGATMEEAFEDAACATFAMMADLSKVSEVTSLDFDFEEADPEIAFVTWLNLLIGNAQAKGLVLGRFELRHNGPRWHGKAWGEPWREDLKRGIEVKGATLTMLSVKQDNYRWEACCVVDV